MSSETTASPDGAVSRVAKRPQLRLIHLTVNSSGNSRKVTEAFLVFARNADYLRLHSSGGKARILVHIAQFCAYAVQCQSRFIAAEADE
jgi:hypothetical protein